MSEVKVNKISPRTACGTTTLGDSGDTFNVPCGSKINLASGGNLTVASGATITNNGTQTGFGRTGTVDWVTTPKVTGDSPVTAATGSGYFLNTTAGTITINLPAGAAGSIVSMADYAATWQTNKVTVSPNGSEKIGGVAAPVNLETEGQSVTLVYVDSTQGWLNTMDSTSNVRGFGDLVATVSGACNTLTTAPCCADAKIAKFVGPGTFTVTNASACAANNIVSYLVVGGGAGSGHSCAGGGGGAGGFRELESPSTPYTSSPLDGYPSAPNRVTISATPGAYPIVVGGGGPKGQPENPGDGTVSTFSTICAAGGGGGGGGNPGRDGGSGGGGGGHPGRSGGSGNTPPTSPAQGFDGGTGVAPGSGYQERGGGGGGALQAGQDAAPNPGAYGGDGAQTSISSVATYYSGGGGGGSGGSGTDPGPGGDGGGGPGGNGGGGTNGTNNTGGAGGGAGVSGAPAAATGGSGIVYIRYKFQN